MSLSKFMVEYERRFNEFKQKNTITPELKRQIKYLLISSMQKLDSNFAIRCRNCSFEEFLAEFYQHKSINKPKPLKNKTVKCNFCGNVEDECRKKKNADKDRNKNVNKKVLSVANTSCNSSHQLDTGSDYHVSGNKDDFSS